MDVWQQPNMESTPTEVDYWIHTEQLIADELQQLLHEMDVSQHQACTEEIRRWMKEHVYMTVIRHMLIEMIEQSHND